MIFKAVGELWVMFEGNRVDFEDKSLNMKEMHHKHMQGVSVNIYGSFIGTWQYLSQNL